MENNRVPRPDLGPAPAGGRRPMSRSRAMLLEALRAQAEPTTLGALTHVTSLHENTVRGHLEALVKAGFATRQPGRPEGRGRPAWLYRATQVEPDGSPEYAGLASALAEAIHRRSPEPVEDAIVAGQGWGRDLAAQRGAEPRRTDPSTDARSQDEATQARHRVVDLLDDLGFAPEADAGATTTRLTRCPLLEAAHRYPDIVCGVHLGLTQGALEAYGADPDGAALLPFAEPGACRLHLAASRP